MEYNLEYVKSSSKYIYIQMEKLKIKAKGLYSFLTCFLFNKVKIINEGKGTLRRDVCGVNNIIEIGVGTNFEKPHITIRGNNNKIVIGKNCKIRKRTIFSIYGDNVIIQIGDNTTLQHDDIIVAQNASITIGEDCMFSNNIHIRSSDSHPIYDNETGKIINSDKSVLIGNHVWLAANCKILKGCVVEDGAVVGAHSIVTKRVPANTIVAGNPARVVKENITWERKIRK